MVLYTLDALLGGLSVSCGSFARAVVSRLAAAKQHGRGGETLQGYREHHEACEQEAKTGHGRVILWVCALSGVLEHSNSRDFVLLRSRQPVVQITDLLSGPIWKSRRVQCSAFISCASAGGWVRAALGTMMNAEYLENWNLMQDQLIDAEKKLAATAMEHAQGHATAEELAIICEQVEGLRVLADAIFEKAFGVHRRRARAVG